MESERLRTPGQEGSDAALEILQLLHRTTPAGGCSLVDICGLLGVSKTTAQAALKGLYSRGRVCTDGHGMGARWVIKDREST